MQAVGNARPDATTEDEEIVQATDAAGTEHAVLLSPVATTSLVMSGIPSSTTAGSTSTFTVTATNHDGTTDLGYTGTVQFTTRLFV